MNFNIENLARKEIKELVPYQSARRLQNKGSIWLNANEYPKPLNIKYEQKNLNRYPNFQPQNVIFNYSNYINLEPKQILVTRGADEGIELLMRVFCQPKKDAIIFCPPTYGMYGISAKILGIKYKSIPLIKNWQLDLKNILKNIDNVKLIYICSPNNPTGNLINKNDLKKLLKVTEKKTIVVLDEAYIEFCNEFSLVYWIKKYNNLVILRTLSKAFALAGLRCGFTLSNEKIINLLLKVIAPYPISTPTSEIAFQALKKNNIEFIKKRIKKLVFLRQWFINKIKNFTCIKKIFPSYTNYILIKFYEAKEIFIKLQKKGIILRDQNTQLSLSNCLRITIGTYKECKQVISILKNL